MNFQYVRFKVIPSCSKFLLLLFLIIPSKLLRLQMVWKKKNIFVRKIDAYKMKNCVRITVGTES